MKEKATIISIIGVIIIVLGYMGFSGVSNQTIDAELLKQSITGLLGFASGTAIGVGGTVYALSNKNEVVEIEKQP